VIFIIWYNSNNKNQVFYSQASCGRRDETTRAKKRYKTRVKKKGKTKDDKKTKLKKGEKIIKR
jgi:hypothetical protein